MALMKSFLRVLFVDLALLLLADGAPVGICLHAYGPDAPADKIECFEYERVERVANDYRFFLASDKPGMVTAYRFRKTIPYRSDLKPGNPEFDTLLKLYEETASSIPSTRRYLNSKILGMRDLIAKQMEERKLNDSLAKVVLDRDEYLSPRYKAVEGGKLVIDHKDGVAKIDLDKISDEQLHALVQIDSKAADLKVCEIGKKRLWNPSMVGISADTVKIKHEKGTLTLKFDDLDEKDRKTIGGWSDGSWKVAKPGFYGPKAGGKSYAELVVENGRFYNVLSWIGWRVNPCP